MKMNAEVLKSLQAVEKFGYLMLDPRQQQFDSDTRDSYDDSTDVKNNDTETGEFENKQIWKTHGFENR